MATRSSKPKTDETETPEPNAPDTPPADAEPTVTVVMTCPSPMTVNARAVAAGDTVTTDPDTAARLIAHGYAAPTDDREVS